MLESIGFASMEDLVESTVPHSIKLTQPIHLDKPLSESEVRGLPFKYIHAYLHTYIHTYIYIYINSDGYLLIEVHTVHTITLILLTYIHSTLMCYCYCKHRNKFIFLFM